MIEALSLATAHFSQDALASQARLRHKIFVELRGLPHFHFEGLEYYEFDAPSAVYLVYRGEGGMVRGLIRLLRTDRPYMLRSYWPDLAEGRSLPQTPDIWETTRVCLDKSAASLRRTTILPELLVATAELLEARGTNGIVGVPNFVFCG